MDSKVEKFIAYALFFAGVLSNGIGVITRLSLASSAFMSIVNTRVTIFSLTFLIAIAISFFPIKQYHVFNICAVYATAFINFPATLFTNRSLVFITYLTILGTAFGLISYKNKKHIISAIVVLVFYLIIISMKVNRWIPRIVIQEQLLADLVYPTNDWLIKHYRELFGGIISSYLFSLLAVTFALTKFTNTNELLLDTTLKDPLTGCFNRSKFEDLIQHKNSISFVAVLDIDNFKSYVKEYGEVAGDTILKNLTNIVSEYTNDDICLYRYARDQFFLVAKSEVEETVFFDNLQRIWTGINYRFGLADQPICVSIGCLDTRIDNDLDVALGALKQLQIAKKYGGAQIRYKNEALMY